MMRILAGCAVAIACAAQAADPVAFVADLKGNATIEGNGRLSFLAELAPGTKLLLGSGAVVSVTYASTGAEFTFGGPGEFLVTATEVRVDKGAVPTRRNVSVLPDAGVVARVARTATASIRMRGVSPETPTKSALEYPVNSRIATLQPTLRWQAGGSSGDVTVSVTDVKGKEVWKSSAKPASVRTGVKLSPATVYTWTVMTPQGTIGEARFETLPSEAMAKAEKSRAAARTFTDRVMHAFLLQDIGATQDAREAWAALARERPDLAELAVLAR